MSKQVLLLAMAAGLGALGPALSGLQDNQVLRITGMVLSAIGTVCGVVAHPPRRRQKGAIPTRELD